MFRRRKGSSGLNGADSRNGPALSTRDLAVGMVFPATSILVGYVAWVVVGITYVAIGLALFLLCATTMLLGLLAYRRFLEHVTKHNRELVSAIKWESGNSFKQIEALLNLRAELGPEQVLPPMRGWAISPDFAVLIVKQMTECSAELILECGSGVSSVLIGAMLRKKGKGRLWSLEHDSEWARHSIKEIRDNGLSDYVTIVHAPLKTYRVEGREWEWYDVSALGECEKFDFVVVDGPPDPEEDMKRYPVLSVLRDRMTKDAVILLDDANRTGERKCLSRWAEEWPEMKWQLIATEKGAAVVSF